MRHAITLRQKSRETLKTMPDPMRTMQLCQGLCDQVPDEVCEAVFETLNTIPGVYRECNAREALATLVAPRMAEEGWCFCPCFPTKRTLEHARIFELVHTNMSNRLAHRHMLEQKIAAERQSAA
jgi:hypothetical protein